MRRHGRKRFIKKARVYGKPKSVGVCGLKNAKSLQAVAEEKIGRRLQALRVLNSYWIGQDAVFKFYEVIVVDPSHNAIRNDPRINWICKAKHKRREARGLTS